MDKTTTPSDSAGDSRTGHILSPRATTSASPPATAVALSSVDDASNQNAEKEAGGPSESTTALGDVRSAPRGGSASIAEDDTSSAGAVTANAAAGADGALPALEAQVQALAATFTAARSGAAGPATPTAASTTVGRAERTLAGESKGTGDTDMHRMWKVRIRR